MWANSRFTFRNDPRDLPCETEKALILLRSYDIRAASQALCDIPEIRDSRLSIRDPGTFRQELPDGQEY